MPHDDGVTVVGVGRVPVTPDVLVARFGAEVTASSVQAALGRCSAALAKIIGVLKDAGVADQDRQTVGARLYQAFDNNGLARGWTAGQQLTAKLRDLGAAGDTVGVAIGAAGEAARLHDLSFAVDDPVEAQNQARDLAYAHAQSTARRYAELAGCQLGPVEAIWETADVPRPGLMPRLVSFADGASPAVEVGEIEITATVEVRWGLVN